MIEAGVAKPVLSDNVQLNFKPFYVLNLLSYIAPSPRSRMFETYIFREFAHVTDPVVLEFLNIVSDRKVSCILVNI